MLKYFLLGFIAKIVTGIDDTLTQIPIINYVTHSKFGKIAFSLGIFTAILVIIIIATYLSSIIQKIPYYNVFIAILMLILALTIYFDVFRKKEVKTTKKQIKKLKTNKRFLKLFLTGFIASFLTILDDTIVFSSILINKANFQFYIIAGIFIATLLEILIIFYFSKFISKLKYKKEITSIALIILSILILTKTI